MNQLLQYPYVKWCMVMFPYGFYRQWNSKLEAPTDLLGHRVVFSLTNGIIYISPFGLFKLFNQFNRFDIEYNKLDKEQYKKAYEETIGYNHRML
jgi:hypothetical protein